jgi:hypothetical protein
VKSVSKQIFLNATVCPALGWGLRSGEIARTELTAGQKFWIEQGIEIGRRARELYPEGLLIEDKWTKPASKKTEKAMNDPDIPVIFEGAFFIDGFAARADILKRKGKSWHLIEVKSGVNDREEFIDDMAYTAMVIDRCGFNVCGVSLVLVSRDFRLGMEKAKLFTEIDHTDEVLARVEEFKPLWQQVEEVTRAPIKPEPQLIFECRRCERFRECMGKDIENHIFDIPRLSQSQFDQLAELGIVRIEDIPDEFLLNEMQARVKDCVLSKEPHAEDSLGSALDSVSWPAYYLDFETVMTAIPLYPDIAPYTQLPTQYSIHKCSDIGLITDHREYLADPSQDCRRELAERLINDLEEDGSIIVYSNFERVVINSLGRLYPDLLEKLTPLLQRIVDLEALIRRNFYHPGFHGRASIKVTGPVLASDISWGNLEIAEGGSAMATFAYLALGKYGSQEAEAMKKNLLEYCQQDTLAMVKLHQRLAEYA